MSNPVATDASIPLLNKRYYLETTKDGIPINKQTPISFQVYNGNGNETIDYLGADLLFISTNIPNGTLTINISNTLQGNRNLYGRVLYMILEEETDNDINLIYTPGNIIEGGVGNIGHLYNIPINSIGVIYIYFTSTDFIVINGYGITIPDPVPMLDGFNVPMGGQQFTATTEKLQYYNFPVPGSFNSGMFDTVNNLVNIPVTGIYKFDLNVTIEWNFFNHTDSTILIQIRRNTINILENLMFYSQFYNDKQSASIPGCYLFDQNDILEVYITFSVLDPFSQNTTGGVYSNWNMKRLQ